METIKALKQKIHWFVLPLLITLLTWIIVTLYAISAQVQVIQKGNENDKEQHQNFTLMQDKIYKTAEESRSFSLQNNNILTSKADKNDLQKIDERLSKIEIKVDKIYNRKGISWSLLNDSSTYFYPLTQNNQ